MLGIIKLFHIIFSSVWFASAFFTSKDLRVTLEKGSPHTELLKGRVNSVSKMNLISGIFTIITGIGLIFALGGFAAVPKAIHTSLLLTIIVLVIDLAVLNGIWNKIESIINKNESLEEAQKLSKKYSMFLGIEHLLRTIILVLMVLKPF
ncbi:MAG: hypothetical protein U0457_17665 [Candidatus Sericytochromatia bacterium]